MTEEQIKTRTTAFIDYFSLELASASSPDALDKLKASWLDRHEIDTPNYRLSEIGFEQSVERGKERLAKRRADGLPDTFTAEEREQMIKEKIASTIKGIAEAKARYGVN